MESKQSQEVILFSLAAIEIDELGRVIITDADLAKSLKELKSKGAKFYPIKACCGETGSYCVPISNCTQ